jgi:hypothetical protein
MLVEQETAPLPLRRRRHATALTLHDQLGSKWWSVESAYLPDMDITVMGYDRIRLKRRSENSDDANSVLKTGLRLINSRAREAKRGLLGAVGCLCVMRLSSIEARPD